MNQQMIVALIENELKRAREGYPKPFHSHHEAYAVLQEEVDEVWTWVKISPRHIKESMRRDYMRNELIQVAAMAIRFIEDLCGEDA